MRNPERASPGLAAFLIIMCPVFCLAQRPPAAPEPQPPPFYGPWSAFILPGGDGLHATLNGNDTILNPESPWTLPLWVNAEDAYHDWHFLGNGDMHPFLAEMQTEFGAPTSLEDFERKAQMMKYFDHRAIFEV